MKHLFSVILLLLLAGCTDPIDPPITINRGSGIEAISSQTVAVVPVLSNSSSLTPGSKVRQSLVLWLVANPDARIIHMVVVGGNGYPNEIVIVAEGKLAR